MYVNSFKGCKVIVYNFIVTEVESKKHYDESQLQGTSSIVRTHYVNYPSHEDATALNQVNYTICMTISTIIINFVCSER